MIKASELIKTFDSTRALDGLSINVKKGSVYGLIGVNGSGKTTALKAITGVLRPDSGSITMDGAEVYENLDIKRCTGFIPDELYFFSSYSLRECAKFYSGIFPRWDAAKINLLSEEFALPDKKRLTRFSKGMQKQAAFILAISSQPDYLILDEPIDGLDPIVRKLVWKHIVAEVAERRMTVLVSSHNLREMEGVCDGIGILDRGKMLLERDLDELRGDIHKVQVAFAEGVNPNYEGLNILHSEKSGRVEKLIVRSPREQVETLIQGCSPLLFDLLPLTLEEIFIYELGGDHIGKLLF
jgi:ABC-2 type transport system ATP-binding protein